MSLGQTPLLRLAVKAIGGLLLLITVLRLAVEAFLPGGVGSGSGWALFNPETPRVWLYPVVEHIRYAFEILAGLGLALLLLAFATRRER